MNSSTFKFWHYLHEVDLGGTVSCNLRFAEKDLVTFSKLLCESQCTWLACMVVRSAVLRAVLWVPIMFRGASFRVLAILHGVIPVQVRSLLSAEKMLSSFTPVFRDTF